MEELAVVLAIFVFALLIAAVVSLINPVWVKQKTRLKGFMVYLAAAFVLTLIVGAIVPQEGSSPDDNAGSEASAGSSERSVKSDVMPSGGNHGSSSILESYPKKVNGVPTEVVLNPDSKDFPDLQECKTISWDPPRNAACQFLAAWRDKSWDTMAMHAQLSWRNRQKDAAGLLAAWFGDIELLGAEVIGMTDVINKFGNMKDVEVTVYYTWPPIVKKETYKIRVINEGEWGFNPTSARGLQGTSSIAIEAHEVKKAMN